MMVFSILSFKLFINFRFFEENLEEPDGPVQTNTEKTVSSLYWFSILDFRLDFTGRSCLRE